ncbi:MAG: hypothetical protein IPJ00_08320 [Saprospirales bacterium]|nr:hypothetical protein [Saprospirales bacterium]
MKDKIAPPGRGDLVFQKHFSPPQAVKSAFESVFAILSQLKFNLKIIVHFIRKSQKAKKWE